MAARVVNFANNNLHPKMLTLTDTSFNKSLFRAIPHAQFHLCHPYFEDRSKLSLSNMYLSNSESTSVSPLATLTGCTSSSSCANDVASSAFAGSNTDVHSIRHLHSS
ncbi:hypothetical protein A2U01_0016903, partial [Trifolium medium]|nr:hypothetical protein [Trifolium medium]